MKILQSFFFAFSFLLPLHSIAQVFGCPDPQASNYNAAATNNDGSCIYNITTIAPVSSVNLQNTLNESSGLVLWDSTLWTHNDNSDLNIYKIDTITGVVLDTLYLSGVVNTDWEEISQDSNYFYIGDFGNNSNGNRTDLHILRIKKDSLMLNQLLIDTIYFSYADQTNFSPTGGNNTDFDCEAFIVDDDSIYLFNKQWLSNQTTIYSFSKMPGIHVANNKGTFDVQGLITGATYLKNKKLVVLSGYSNLLQPFLLCLYDFNQTDYFSGNKRKINLQLPFHQIEGIATANGLKYFLTNEYFTQAPIITTPQKLHDLDLSAYLADYLASVNTSVAMNIEGTDVLIYPNPVGDKMYIEWNGENELQEFIIYDNAGITIITGILKRGINTIDLNDIPNGNYFLNIGDHFSNPITKLN